VLHKRSTALEAEEAEANQQLQLAKKTGDAQQIEYLTRRWLKLTTQLREFDRAVEQFRRDSGQLVELKKAVQVMDWIGLWLMMGIQRLLQTAPETLAAISEPAALHGSWRHKSAEPSGIACKRRLGSPPPTSIRSCAWR
jgi:hypothetical protein